MPDDLAACSSCFKGSTPPLPGITRAYPNLAAALFSNTFFYNDWSQKYLKLTPHNHPKSQISVKNQLQNALTIKTWEKTPSQGGQASKIDNIYKLSAVFQKAQGSPKGVKMEARMESLGTLNHKNPETRTLGKKTTSRDRKK